MWRGSRGGNVVLWHAVRQTQNGMGHSYRTMLATWLAREFWTITLPTCYRQTGGLTLKISCCTTIFGRHCATQLLDAVAISMAIVAMVPAATAILRSMACKTTGDGRRRVGEKS